MARLLRRLGVLDPLLKTAVRLETGWEFRRWQDGTVLSAEDLATRCERLYGEHTYTAHRADLLDAHQAGPSPTAPSASAGAASTSRSAPTRQTGPARLTFADGEVIDADVVIGADGIHSLIRAAVTETAETPPAYSAAARSAPWSRPGTPPRSPAARPRCSGSAPATTWCTTRSARAS